MLPAGRIGRAGAGRIGDNGEADVGCVHGGDGQAGSREGAGVVPPRALEAMVAWLLRVTVREQVLGDLRERYESPAQYVAKAVRVVPMVVVGRIRRTADAQLSLLLALLCYLCYLGEGWFAPEPGLGLIRLARPVAMTLLGTLLADAYSRRPRAGAGPAEGTLLVFERGAMGNCELIIAIGEALDADAVNRIDENPERVGSLRRRYRRRGRRSKQLQRNGARATSAANSVATPAAGVRRTSLAKCLPRACPMALTSSSGSPRAWRACSRRVSSATMMATPRA